MMNADMDQVVQKFLSAIKADFSRWDGGFSIILPFLDHFGEPIEFNISFDEADYSCDDLGRIAGLLFTLNQHTQEAPGHRLVRNVAQSLGIDMDYNYGLLKKGPTPIEDTSTVLEFIKALLALHTAVPALDIHRAERKRRKRLATRLGREITQLKMPEYVQKQTEVKGEHLRWPIDYKYIVPLPTGQKEVYVVAVDLWGKDSQGKAGQAISLAADLKSLNGYHDLRIVYDLNGATNDTKAMEAASFIQEWGKDLKYTPFNYGALDEKERFMSLTLQELLPMSRYAN